MKKIFIPNQSKQTLGGGFIFIENLKKGLQTSGLGKLVNTWQECDAVLIASVTMTDRKEIDEAKAAKKKIILRVDNMPKDSRNRGTAFSRMKDYGKTADFIIFQSEWAREYVGSWLEFNHGVNLNKSKVIYNGVDTEFFYFKDDPNKRPENYIFISFNNDENKRYPEAAYYFYQKSFEAKKAKKPLPLLKIVGNLANKDLPGYKFDFFNDEKIEYTPPINDRKKVGDMLRSCKYLLFPAFADASPNTISEAMACGCKPELINPVGGSQEVVDQYSKKILTIQDMAKSYVEVM